MIEALLVHLERYTHLTQAEKELLLQHAQFRTVEKNELIIREGDLATRIYFLVSGCVRLFYNVNGIEKTAFFYTEGQFICAGESYTYHVPAKENYQAVEQSQLAYFPEENIEQLLKESSKFELLARIATENELINCQHIIASFVTKSAEERYSDLLENRSDLFLRVPQQYIASFLGVSPETLSRIKKRVHLRMKLAKKS